jgi:fumarate reductase subunit D
MIGWVCDPIVKLYLLVSIVFPLFDTAQRIKFTIVDLVWKVSTATLSVVCYGGAALATGATLAILGQF